MKLAFLPRLARCSPYASPPPSAAPARGRGQARLWAGGGGVPCPRPTRAPGALLTVGDLFPERDEQRHQHVDCHGDQKAQSTRRRPRPRRPPLAVPASACRPPPALAAGVPARHHSQGRRHRRRVWNGEIETGGPAHFCWNPMITLPSSLSLHLSINLFSCTFLFILPLSLVMS